MGRWLNTFLDILASDRAEIRKIDKALQEPCEELILWFAREFNEEPNAPFIKSAVAFERTCDLGYKARQYKNYCKNLDGLIVKHVCFVSRDFPKAIFLLEHWDTDGDYSGKLVIHAGDVIRFSQDDGAREKWALPDIFAPYQAEHELGLEFGSLWDDWVDDMRKEIAELAGAKA